MEGRQRRRTLPEESMDAGAAGPQAGASSTFTASAPAAVVSRLSLVQNWAQPWCSAVARCRASGSLQAMLGAQTQGTREDGIVDRQPQLPGQGLLIGLDQRHSSAAQRLDEHFKPHQGRDAQLHIALPRYPAASGLGRRVWPPPPGRSAGRRRGRRAASVLVPVVAQRLDARLQLLRVGLGQCLELW